MESAKWLFIWYKLTRTHQWKQDYRYTFIFLTLIPEVDMNILETDRLLLRHLEPDDLDALYALYRDPEMRRYYPEGTLTFEETKEELLWHANGHPDHPELGLWATILKAGSHFVGRCGLLPWKIDEQFEVEIAFMIDKAYWRQGLASEAALAIRDYGFNTLHLPRLVCLIEEENIASVNTARKIGMQFEREGEDEIGPFHLYAIANPTMSEVHE